MLEHFIERQSFEIWIVIYFYFLWGHNLHVVNTIPFSVQFHEFWSGSVVKNPAANAGDAGSISGSGRSPGEGNGSYSSILVWNHVDRGAWRATVHGFTQSWPQLSGCTEPWVLTSVRSDLIIVARQFPMPLWRQCCGEHNVRVSFCVGGLCSSNDYPELLDHVVVLFFNFLRKLHTVFHNGYANLYSHQQFTRVPFPPHPHQHLLFLVFLTNRHYYSVRW